MVENAVVVEVKAVQHILPVHRAQLLTYLWIAGYEVGLILNFHAAVMKDGIVRMVRSPNAFASQRLPVQAASPHARCLKQPEGAGPSFPMSGMTDANEAAVVTVEVR